MAPVRRVVVDVLKPHAPSMLEFADRVAEAESVEGVTASLIEHDREVQNVELTVEGADVEFSAVEAAVEQLGGTVHSIDQVACGERVAPGSATGRDA